MSEGHGIAAVRHQNLANDELGLLAIVDGLVEANGIATLVLRKQCLLATIDVVRNHG